MCAGVVVVLVQGCDVTLLSLQYLGEYRLMGLTEFIIRPVTRESLHAELASELQALHNADAVSTASASTALDALDLELMMSIVASKPSVSPAATTTTASSACVGESDGSAQEAFVATAKLIVDKQ